MIARRTATALLAGVALLTATPTPAQAATAQATAPTRYYLLRVTTVPNVLGMDQESAVARLQAARLAVAVRVEKSGGDYPKVVRWQSPAPSPRVLVRYGTTVTIGLGE